MLGAQALRFVARHIIFPADDRRGPKAVDHADVVGDAFVELIDVPHLPGAQHLGNEVVDPLFIGAAASNPN